MATINTVTGTCKPEDLGFTLIHEHLTAGLPGFEYDPHPFDRKAAIADCSAKLSELKDLGVRGFVDPCPMELGRDPVFAAEVSDKSGLHVVMATGLYNEALGIPVHFRLMDVDGIAEIYEQELTKGIGSTDIKAGIIKVATGGIPGVTPPGAGVSAQEHKTLIAAAKAHKATGAPILVHNSEHEPYGREVLDVFESEGVDFNRVLIGHADGLGDMKYHFDILDRGAWLGFDRFGLEAIASDKLRLACLIGLLTVGYDRIMLSQDHVNCWLGKQGDAIGNMIKASPNWNYTHVCRNIIPWLKDHGVEEATIQKLMVDNPRNYVAG
jgi:phosphotriesterase-related protein